jgi:hypothetical protein
MKDLTITGIAPAPLSLERLIAKIEAAIAEPVPDDPFAAGLQTLLKYDLETAKKMRYDNARN